MLHGPSNQPVYNICLLVVILVVLTEREFMFSLFFSQLLAKAIPVRGAKFRKADVERNLLFI
ncbi:hypothetical protein [Dickeya zeae]|uniref:hypothetical protein n=1 Tax=Dickeya zeae TaxID=204042 RepID=UPI001440295C|nr:hypothetical protein [Dickeya zeae]QIZ46769.1 hypothetical protein DWV07_07680 [Dickeya zeae]